MTSLSDVDDIHVCDFAHVLQGLEPRLPISDQYELNQPSEEGRVVVQSA